MPETHVSIPPVHLKKNAGRLGSVDYRAFPLEIATPLNAIEQLTKVVKYLDVEHSPRYRRTSLTTFCNVYAYDVCYQLGVYLPRVWWSALAIKKMTDTPGTNVDVQYGVSVFELNANALHGWLDTWGTDYGWERLGSSEILQTQVNRGGVGVISVSSGNATPGHISIVVPEDPAIKNKTVDGVFLPLQSQAGAVNFCFSCGTGPWWLRFPRRGFWVHKLS